MILRTVSIVFGVTASIAIAGCSSPSDEPASLPDTATTMPEGQNETTGAIEPSVGSAAKPGGGIPDASQPDVTPNPDGTNPVPPQPRDQGSTPPA